MAALVQSSSTTILQHRPASSAELLESQGTQQFRSVSHPYQLAPRSISYTQGMNNNMNGGYRGVTGAPVAPYAFTSTPGIQNNVGHRPANRIDGKFTHNTEPSQRTRYPGTPSTSSTVSSTSTSSSNPGQAVVERPQQTLQPPSKLALPNSTPAGVLNASTATTGLRPSPDRYRRGQRRVNSGGIASDGFTNDSMLDESARIYTQPVRSNSSPSLPLQPTSRQNVPGARASGQFSGNAIAVGPGTGVGIRPIFVGAGDMRVVSMDDSQAFLTSQSRMLQQQDLANRRKSLGAFDSSFQNGVSVNNNVPNFAALPRDQIMQNLTIANMPPPVRPEHNRARNSNESFSSRKSASSTRSQVASSKQDAMTSTISANNSGPGMGFGPDRPIQLASPRGSYNDINKRTNNPSPLSKPAAVNTDTASIQKISKDVDQTSSQNESPIGSSRDNAVDRLAALQIDPKKGLKSRLRRAFSFGSAAELRHASMNPDERARLKLEKEEAEQLRIAQRQEASGLGNAIYSNNQGNIFSGSTDNLSIQSTASSASVMLRKMGKGMKRQSRSLAGLFRPKSVIGVPAASGPVIAPTPLEPSLAQVSMVTVEAEREKVNVNVSPHEQAGGGTGFPKLERNSLDAARRTSTNSIEVRPDFNNSRVARRSIVGGERERAEVLNAVKKGILKHSGSASPIVKPTELPVEFQLPQIPVISSEPPSPDLTKAKRMEGRDYFLTPLAPPTSVYKSAMAGTTSAPTTPSEMKAAKANVSFNLRNTYYDTWPSSDYDRRGEISTCNRLTPLLAQQIKEELNTFKMPYTWTTLYVDFDDDEH